MGMGTNHIVWLLHGLGRDGQWKMVAGYTATSREEAQRSADDLQKSSPLKYRCVPYERCDGTFCAGCGAFIDSDEEARKNGVCTFVCLKCAG
jgi:hypothetical protein